MSKLIILCLVFLAIPGMLVAQNDSLRIRTLSDSIASLYNRYLGLNRQLNNNNNRLDDKIKVIENQSSANSERLDKFLKNTELRTYETIYKNSKLSFISSANFMNSVNEALNALEFTVSSLDYSNSIFELNNPTNSDLGFSLDKVILKIVDEKIINSSKNGRRFGDRLKSILSGIINNPIINNPITKAIVTTVPAVSSITSVFNVVNSLAVGETTIGTEMLKSFSKDLEKYVGHYEALARASSDLDFNLTSLKVKTEALRKLANNFTTQSVIDLYTRDQVTGIEKMDMNSVVKKYFNYAATTEYIEKLEQKNGSYEFLSRRVVFPITNRSKISFILEEIERLYSEYVTTLNTYHNSIIAILNNANNLSEEPAKIKNKISKLETQFKTLLINYERNVDLSNIKALEANVPRY